MTSSNVEITSATQFSITLNAADQINVEGLLNKSGTSSVDATTYNLAAAADWNPAHTGNADTTGNSITVSNVQIPTITSTTHDASTGTLTVTGSNFVKASGAANDIDASKFTFTGEGGATYTLTDSADVEITSGTAFTITLSSTDKAAINQIINKNGTGFLQKSGASNDIDLSRLTITGEGGATYTLTTAVNVEITSGTSFSATLSGADLISVEALLNKDGTSSASSTTYNLAGAEDWAAGADAAVTVADLTGNAITVSNYTAPAITSATFDASTNVLTVTGTNLVSNSGATNDVAVSLLTLTGEGGSYTLTSSDVEVTSATAFSVTLNAADQLVVHGLLNKNGTASSDATTYNIATAED